MVCGSNQYGQLGTGNTNNQYIFIPIPLPDYNFEWNATELHLSDSSFFLKTGIYIPPPSNTKSLPIGIIIGVIIGGIFLIIFIILLLLIIRYKRKGTSYKFRSSIYSDLSMDNFEPCKFKSNYKRFIF